MERGAGAVVPHALAWTWLIGLPAVVPTFVAWLILRRSPAVAVHASAALRFQAIVAVVAAVVWVAVLWLGWMTGLIWVAPQLQWAGPAVGWLSIIPGTRAAIAAGRTPYQYPLQAPVPAS